MSKLQSSLAVVLCAIFLAPSARADIQLSSVGIHAAETVKQVAIRPHVTPRQNVSAMHQHGILLRYRVNSRSTKLWIPRSLDLAAGMLKRGDIAGLFVSFGPSYRYDIRKSEASRWFADFGVHPTYIAKSTYGDQPIGGHFYFTSYVGLGAYLGRQRKTSVLVRYQHTSNAGINDPNPGLDMLGLTFSYHFGGDQQLFSAKAAK